MGVTLLLGFFYLALAGSVGVLVRRYYIFSKADGGFKSLLQNRRQASEYLKPVEEHMQKLFPQDASPNMESEINLEADLAPPPQEELKLADKDKATNIPREIIPQIRKAEALIARKELEEAQKILIKILSWDDDNADAGAHLAYIYLQTGEFMKAENLFRKVLEQRPRDSSLLTNLSLAIFEQKNNDRVEESIGYLRKAAELDSQNSQRYSNLGQSLFFAGDIDGAIAAFERAVKIEPKNIELLFFLADSHLAVEHYQNAKKVFLKILDLSPLNKEAQYEVDQLKKIGY
jgi:tetratricopeptide (TPR) repeat protein